MGADKGTKGVPAQPLKTPSVMIAAATARSFLKFLFIAPTTPVQCEFTTSIGGKYHLTLKVLERLESVGSFGNGF